MTKAERDLLLLMANWLVAAIARQGCLPHHLVDAIECVGSEGRRKAHPNTAILLAAEDSRVRTWLRHLLAHTPLRDMMIDDDPRAVLVRLCRDVLKRMGDITDHFPMTEYDRCQLREFGLHIVDELIEYVRQVDASGQRFNDAMERRAMGAGVATVRAIPHADYLKS